MEIACGRIELVRALCAYPPALRVIGRWYGLVANGTLEPGQIIDTYNAFHKGEMSEIASQASGLTQIQKAEVTSCAAQIVTLVSSLGAAGGENAGVADSLHSALHAMPPLDRHLGKLADRCLEAPPDGSDLSAIVTANRRIDRAKQTLVDRNQGICHSTVRQYQKRGLSREDLMQEANVAMFLAVDRFKPELGSFRTSAIWWIRQGIRQALLSQSQTIRLPIMVARDLRKIDQATILLQCRGQEVTPGTLARKTGLSSQRLKSLQEIAPPPASLDAPAGEESDTKLCDFIVDPHTVDPVQTILEARLREVVGGVLEDLKPRERDIVIQRLGLDGRMERSLETIGKQYGVTRERIRQIENKAMAKIERHKPMLEKFGVEFEGVDIAGTARSANIDWKDETVGKRLEDLWRDKSLEPQDIADQLSKDFGQPVSRDSVMAASTRAGLERRPSSRRRSAAQPA